LAVKRSRPQRKLALGSHRLRDVAEVDSALSTVLSGGKIHGTAVGAHKTKVLQVGLGCIPGLLFQRLQFQGLTDLAAIEVEDGLEDFAVLAMKRQREPVEAVPYDQPAQSSECLCSAIIGSLRRKRVGVQTTRTELGAKQRWTKDLRAGIIARDNNPYLRGTPWR
jgi:hypothetical protein